jgi:hypothetical protein
VSGVKLIGKIDWTGRQRVVRRFFEILKILRGNVRIESRSGLLNIKISGMSFRIEKRLSKRIISEAI